MVIFSIMPIDEMLIPNGFTFIKESLPESDQDCVVFIWIKDGGSHFVDYAIGHYNQIEKSNNYWTIQDSPITEYPANYFEGEWTVIAWMQLPAIE